MVSKLSALSKRCAFLARLAQVRMTLAYAFVVTCVSTALQCLGPAVQGRVISHASTAKPSGLATLRRFATRASEIVKTNYPISISRCQLANGTKGRARWTDDGATAPARAS